MQRALLELLFLGVVGGIVGCWIIFYDLAYSAESLAHALFPGSSWRRCSACLCSPEERRESPWPRPGSRSSAAFRPSAGTRRSRS